MSDLVHLRAPRPLTDSYGHVWAAAGAVVAVSREQADELLAIVDAGLTVVDPPASAGSKTPVAEPAPAPVRAVTEPAPAEAAEKPQPRPRRPRQPKRVEE